MIIYFSIVELLLFHREVLAKYSDEMLELAKTLLALISESLGVEADAIEKACGEGQQKVLLNYYPTCPRPDLTLGLKRHTDPGTLTILLQDKVGGLQATKDNGKTWVTVEPIDGAFVVNIGDQMHVSIYIYLFLFVTF
jgi:naringenin 3-dioxygenase